MALPSYDILKKDSAALVWVEAVDDLESAKRRIQELSSRSNGDGEYVIFDQRSRQIVDRVTVSAQWVGRPLRPGESVSPDGHNR